MTVDPAPASRVRLAARGVDHPHSVTLLKEFYQEQHRRYGWADPVDLAPAAYRPPAGIFAVIYDGDTPLGCGGCHWLDRGTSTAEIKKTFVVAAARGRGLGRLLLGWLEDQAIGWGATRLILETGVRNTAAIDLFERSGFVPVSQYVAGRDPLVNRAFVKALTQAPSSSTPE